MSPIAIRPVSTAAAAAASSVRPDLAGDVVIFDVLSHATMHLQFNEAYLRLVHAACPGRRILFHARQGHLDSMSQRTRDLDRLEMRPCAPFSVPFDRSHHSPLAGRWAGMSAIRDMRRRLAGCRAPSLVAVLGVDANLYALLTRGWRSVADTRLHLILHSQLGDAMLWRSRNPVLRIFDFVSAIDRRLPANISLVALELGVRDAIGDVTTKPLPGIITLEHPVLRSEWPIEHPRPVTDTLRIGFIGHSSKTKGFGLFAEIARKHWHARLRFEAIGMWAPDTDTMDLSGLDRLPTHGGLPRDAYLRALDGVDAVCLPLASRAYDFIASGSVSDAIAARKPLLALRTRTLAAIWGRYGPIGYLAETEKDLTDYVGRLSLSNFRRESPLWRENLAKLRQARLPESLARHYPGLIGVDRNRC